MIEHAKEVAQRLREMHMHVPADTIDALVLEVERLTKVDVEPVAWMWKDGTLTADPDMADGTWTPLVPASALAAEQTKQVIENFDELKAQNAQLLGALKGLEPYLDRLVCYASTATEHKPNEAVMKANAAIAAVQSNASTHSLNSANSLE